MQAEGIGQAAGGDVERAAGGGVNVHCLRPDRHGDAPVVVGGDANEDAGLGVHQAGGEYGGAFQGFPGNLEDKALLRIHRVCFARRDAKELGIELVNIIQKAAKPGAGL